MQLNDPTLPSSHHNSNSIQKQTPPNPMASLSPAHSAPLTLFSLFFFHCLASADSAVVPAVYVFGDSLADVGNNNYLKLSVLKADFPHNGVDYHYGKATGRFSNGKNSADFLAEKLGVPSSAAYLSIPPCSNRAQAFLNGVSFASGGAGVMESTNTGQCITLDMQIGYFTAMCTELVQQLGSSQAQYHLSKSIFSFTIGNNDILDYVKFGHGTTPQGLVDSMITALRAQLKAIYNLGARKFAFVGTGPIGCCPHLLLKNGTGGCHPQANTISLMYARAAAALLEGMSSELSGMNYSFFNSTLTLQQYLNNPAAYGFTETRAACCGLGNLNAKVACIPLSIVCSNRSNHVFWDLFHPSETTSGLLMSAFYEGSPPNVYPINVKQLSDL